MGNTPNLANDTPLEGTNSPDLVYVLMIEKKQSNGHIHGILLTHHFISLH